MEIVFILILLLIVLYRKKNICEKYNNNNKIAFIFLTIGEIKQHKIWKLFFKSAYNYNIYVHPKKPEEIQSFFKNYIIKNNVPTLWGDVSLVHATNLLIKEAMKDETNKKIILVSDSCIPIKTYDYIYKAVFEDNKSWFNYYSPNTFHFL